MSRRKQSLWRRLRSPSFYATLRGRVSGVWRVLFEALGRYEPISPAEKELVLRDRVAFSGDAPLQIAGGGHEQGRMVFRLKRPAFEAVENLVVTRSGAGWANGRLVERYSAGAPGLRRFFERRNAAETVSKGYHIQAAHKETYGDWVSEYLCAILRQKNFDAPLFLPAELSRRDYVKRDLQALGVKWRAVDHPIVIKSAVVLRQQKHFVHFGPEDVGALRAIFPPPSTHARPGGIAYLSRRGERSEVAQRFYPHEAVEEIVKARGGQVILTAQASPKDYLQAAPHAETVVFDHGSAFYNSLRWPVRRVVEIVSDDWWNNAFLMLADARGIRDYTIIRGDLGERHVKEALARALDRPLDRTGET